MRTMGALLAVALVASGTSALADPAVVTVSIREPVPGQPALGAVDVVVSVVSSNAVRQVELLLDGRSAAVLTSAPWRHALELGTDNKRHEITAVATDVLGNTGADSVVTEPIPDSGTFGVSLQQQYLTVTRDGTRVLDLDAGDFTVRDKGHRQQIVTFARGEIPFTAVLAIDASSSMRGQRLAAAAAGVRAFVERTAPLDQVSLLAFSDRVLERTPFENRVEAFEEALTRLAPGDGTAVHDHLYMAAKLLQQRQGRRVVVLLSDGIDSHSVLAMDDIVRTIQQSQALIYWVWLGSESGQEFDHGQLRTVFSQWRPSDEYHKQFEMLQEAVRDTGGRIIPIESVDQIEPVFIDILAELREQYVLGYYPSNERNDGAWHAVDVDASGAGLKVRTSAGYLDY